MIGRVLPRGKHTAGVLHYLFGKGKRNQHVNPRLVAAWTDLAGLEPPLRADGKRSLSQLAAELDLPVRLAGGNAPEKHVYHLTVRAAPEDPDQPDARWAAIAADIMDRLGLSARGREDQGVKWVAVHHGDNHIHIVATLARQDGRRAQLKNDFYRIGEAVRDAEAAYGLRRLDHNRTAPKAPTRAERERSERSGRPTDRSVLHRHVRAVLAAARTEAEFFAGLEARGVLVHRRPSALHPGEVSGYAVALPVPPARPGGPARRPVWYGGGKLAADLSLPKLRSRWAGPRLAGQAMTGPAARAVLAREALRAARAARSEPEFFAALERAGLQVRLRPGPGPGTRPAGWAATLPGLAGPDGQPLWLAGGKLDQALQLGQLRARWQHGQAGAPPGADYFDGADRAEIYEHAARAADWAAREVRAGRAGRADAARAAADLLTAPAEATGNPALAQAAENFTRAARAAWGRSPAPGPAGPVLRTAAYLIASSRPGRRPRPARAWRLMLTALASLARTLAELRAAQARGQQAAAAARAAARLADVAAAVDHEAAPGLAAASFPRPPRPGRPGPAPRPAARIRTRPPAPGRGGPGGPGVS